MTSDYLKQLQSGLDPDKRLYQIIEHGMCIGCGICQSIAGPDVVKMEMVENGWLRPVVKQHLSQETMDTILDVCPGTRVDGLPRSDIDETSKEDGVWGVWRDIYYAWSGEAEIRHLASTGGLLTGLALYLIDSGEVDFIVHACEPRERPTFGERFISRSRNDVLKAAGSRYGPTATLVDIIEIIDQAEKNGETFALIGTPCDVGAIRNYARHDSRVDNHCAFMMCMVCGGFMAPYAMKAFLESLGVPQSEVSSLRFRGHGCPGPTTIKTRAGGVIEKNYLEFWGEDESVWQLPPRCKVCPDGIGDSADIAASDTWIGGSPTWEEQTSDPGFNAAIVRTDSGVGLMDRAIAAGYIARGDNLTPRDMDKFQPHQEKKKRTVWARFQGMKLAENIVPDTHGLNLKLLSEENDQQYNIEQMEGARERVIDGKFSEPAPRPKQT